MSEQISDVRFNVKRNKFAKSIVCYLVLGIKTLKRKRENGG